MNRRWLNLLGLGWGSVGVIGCALATDALFYGVIKSHQYEQAPGLPPQLLATNAFAFNAFVVCATNHSVTNATVKVPDRDGTVHTLGVESNGVALRFEARFETQSALDAAYPSSGSLFDPSVYTLTLQTVHDGAPTPKVSYFLVSQPKTPTIANLPAAQAIDGTQDFTLEWNAFGGTLLDIVQVLVTDHASNLWFVSPFPFTPGALDGRATSTVIPAGQLPPGRDLMGHLLIARPGLPNTNSYPGAIGIAALLRDTAFPLTTRPARPPVLEVRSAHARPFQMDFSGESNRVYHLFATTNLVAAAEDPGAWQHLLTTNSPSGRGTLTDTQSVTWPHRSYRLSAGP